MSHSKEFKAYAAEVAEYPEVKSAILAMKGNKPASLADRGGFVAIRERVHNGALAHDDTPTVLLHVKGRAYEHKLAQTQEQDRGRGGRSR